MAPEHDARTRAFYDHESDEPAPGAVVAPRPTGAWTRTSSTACRAAAFTRAERRAAPRRGTVVDLDATRRSRRARRPRRGAEPTSRGAREPAPRARRPRGRARRARRARVAADAAPRRATSRARARPRRSRRADEPPRAAHGRRVVARRVSTPRRRRRRRGESPRPSCLARRRAREPTIVLERRALERRRAARRAAARAGRSKISGHPDRLPAPRPQRPPRTAVERIGTRPGPDRRPTRSRSGSCWC